MEIDGLKIIVKPQKGENIITLSQLEKFIDAQKNRSQEDK